MSDIDLSFLADEELDPNNPEELAEYVRRGAGQAPPMAAAAPVELPPVTVTGRRGGPPLDAGLLAQALGLNDPPMEMPDRVPNDGAALDDYIQRMTAGRPRR